MRGFFVAGAAVAGLLASLRSASPMLASYLITAATEAKVRARGFREGTVDLPTGRRASYRERPADPAARRTADLLILPGFTADASFMLSLVEASSCFLTADFALSSPRFRCRARTVSLVLHWVVFQQQDS